jgi:DNA-binding transcriptional MerR regulator
MEKAPEAFRTIGEVSDLLGTPAHVLRFWESRFPQIKPVKRTGGRRYYRPNDVALLAGLQVLLHEQGLTIKGAQKILRDEGVRHVVAIGEDRIGQSAATGLPAVAEVLAEIESAQQVPPPPPRVAPVIPLRRPADPQPDLFAAASADADAVPASGSTAPPEEISTEGPGAEDPAGLTHQIAPAVPDALPMVKTEPVVTPPEPALTAADTAPEAEAPAKPPAGMLPDIPDTPLPPLGPPLAGRLRHHRAVSPDKAALARLRARLLALRTKMAQASGHRSHG